MGQFNKITINYDEFGGSIIEDFTVDNNTDEFDIIYIIDNLKNFESLNDDLDVDTLKEQGYDEIPLYATVHGTISFNIGKERCPWDSGRAGKVLYKKKANINPLKLNDIVNNDLWKLTNAYNGFVYEVIVQTVYIEETHYTIEDWEMIDGGNGFFMDEVEDAVNTFADIYGVHEANIDDKSMTF